MKDSNIHLTNCWLCLTSRLLSWMMRFTITSQNKTLIRVRAHLLFILRLFKKKMFLSCGWSSFDSINRWQSQNFYCTFFCFCPPVIQTVKALQGQQDGGCELSSVSVLPCVQPVDTIVPLHAQDEVDFMKDNYQVIVLAPIGSYIIQWSDCMLGLWNGENKKEMHLFVLCQLLKNEQAVKTVCFLYSRWWTWRLIQESQC